MATDAASGASDLFVRANAPLRPANAVAALLLLEDGRYLMQLRDRLPHIFYPDHWGCFGGAVDAGEQPQEALLRELREEIGFEAGGLREFTRLTFDWRSVGHAPTSRTYYEVSVPGAAWRDFVLGEGAAMQPFAAAELLARRNVTPYDAFAIWMHHSRERLAAGARGNE